MMRWIVFGASGATGQALVAQLALAGHQVRAQHRRAPSAPVAGVEPRILALEPSAALDEAIAGCDAVACVFGPRGSSRDVFCAAATEAVIEAMRRVGARRLLCQTGAMITASDPNLSAPMRAAARMFEASRPEQAEDRREQERLVMRSGLDWTLIKPPRLSDEPLRGGVVSGEAIKMRLMSRVGREDLARFIIESAGVAERAGQRLFVRYGG